MPRKESPEATQIAAFLRRVNPNLPEHRNAVTRALLFIFGQQTDDERQSQNTWHDNGVGFTGFDAPVLTPIAIKAKKLGQLSYSETKFVAKKLVKYRRQLVALAAMKKKVPQQTGMVGIDRTPGKSFPESNCPDCKLSSPVSHNGSRDCRSGSIASGGNRAHCSCNTCY